MEIWSSMSNVISVRLLAASLSVMPMAYLVADEGWKGGRIILDIAIVGNTLTGDGSLFEQFMILRERDPRRADYLTNHWWNVTLAACDLEYSRAIEHLVAKEGRDVDMELAVREIHSITEPCRHNFISNRWDDIRRSVFLGTSD